MDTSQAQPGAVHDNTEIKTRANLSYFWSVVSSLILSYIVVRWGDRLEILTLIIGLIGGTVIGGIFGVFFAGAFTAKKPDTTINTNADQTNLNVNPQPNPTTDVQTQTP